MANTGRRGGYLKIYRSMMDKHWFNDSQAVHLWMYLLMEATHAKQNKEAYFGDAIIKLQPGQLITGRKELAKKLKISPSKVERLLKMWTANDQQIEQVTTSKGRLISILNWDKYQLVDSEVDSNQTATGQPPDTIRRIKEEDKEKEILKEKEKSGLSRQLPSSPSQVSPEKLCKHLSISKQLLLSFDAARNFYPGSKRGLQTELRYFIRCHKKEAKEIIPFLESAIRNQIEERKERKKRGVFVPEWKHFKTWIYNSWWESDI